MKVVVLGTRGFPDVQGGVEKHCEQLYPRLVELGCDVTVITRTPYISKERRVAEWNGVRFIHLWCPKRKSFEAITHTLLGILSSKFIRPDILHIHAIGPSLLTPIANLLGLPVVMTHHGPDYERAKWGTIAKAVLKIGERTGVNSSKRIIAISRGIQNHIKDKYKKDAIFIPNGVNIPEPVAPGKALKKWRLEPKGYVFSASRFVPEKGLHNLIEAYRMIKSPTFKLVIAGEADHETSYSRHLKKLAVETKGVVLTGFVTGETLAELYSNAGLFVLSSYYEGLPIALLEALSYGLPVLVSDIPQHREISLNKFRYYKLGDIRELSLKLVECFNTGIENSGKERYLSILQTEYNWDNIAGRTLEVYKDIISAN